MQRIGLFVIGHSPAIILETLVARCVNRMLPDRVFIVTTETGKNILTQRLFSQGGWNDFCDVWPKMKAITFDETSILVPAGVDDIRTDSENRAMTGLIFSMVKDCVEQSDMLDASLAGGRKTMGYYLGLAMSLFAREQDRLTHVLVPAEWEHDRSFLFPKQTQADQVVLMDIPFIRLKSHVKPSVNRMETDALVASAQTAVDRSVLEPVLIYIKRRVIRYLGKEILLSEREFAIYLFFARQKLLACVQVKRTLCGECTDCFLSVDEMDIKKEELLQTRAMFGGVNSGHYERFEKAWSESRAAQANLSEPLRRITESIEKVFAMDPRAEVLMIKNIGKRGSASYGLMADKTQVRIEKEVKP